MTVTRQRDSRAQVFLHGRVTGPETPVHRSAKAALVEGVDGHAAAGPFRRRKPELARIIVHAVDADDDMLRIGRAFCGPDAQSKSRPVMTFHHAFAVEQGRHRRLSRPQALY